MDEEVLSSALLLPLPLPFPFPLLGVWVCEAVAVAEAVSAAVSAAVVVVTGSGSGAAFPGVSSSALSCLFFLTMRLFMLMCSTRRTRGGLRFIPWRALTAGGVATKRLATAAAKKRVSKEGRVIFENF